MKRMFEDGENVFYYITTMNENYVHPDMPEGVEEGIVRGLYPLKKSAKKGKKRVQLMSAGTIMREVEAAAVILEKDYGVAADIWSMTSVNELARDGHKVSRHNMMNPAEEQEVPYVTKCLARTEGPIIAATDYIRAHTNQIREFMPRSFTVLGTDGFGRSDTRAQLREFFEVDRRYVVLAAMTALADEGAVSRADVAKVMTELGIDPASQTPQRSKGGAADDASNGCSSDIGGAEGAEVVELLVAVGDAIELEQSLIVLESDKASMEIPASHAGVVVELKMAVGDQLSEGDAILVLDTSAADGDNADASQQEALSIDQSAVSTDADLASTQRVDEGSKGLQLQLTLKRAQAKLFRSTLSKYRILVRMVMLRSSRSVSALAI